MVESKSGVALPNTKAGTSADRNGGDRLAGQFSERVIPDDHNLHHRARPLARRRIRQSER